MFNRNKKLKFFIVIHADNPGVFLTIVRTKKEAVDFAYKYLRIKNFDHFEMWCSLRDYQTNSEQAWNEYFNKVVSIEEKQKYLVRSIQYNLSDLTAVLRMFCGCVPVGCSYETKAEYDYLNHKLETQKMAQEITDKLDSIINQKEEQTKDGE